MKKILFYILCTVFFSSLSGTLGAQQIKEPISSSQKSDDGVFVAYPNPAKDVVLVKAKNSALKIKSVTFYSILGTQVAHFVINKNAGEINVDRLKPGKYLIRYTLSDNSQKVTQIVKQ